MQTNILEYLEATAPRLPQKIAYSDGKSEMCFEALLHTSRAIGSSLLGSGARCEPIAILMEKTPYQIAAFYGVLYAGCFYVPMDLEMPAGRIELILQTVGARRIIVDAKGEKTLQKLDFSGTVYSYDDGGVRYAPVDCRRKH